ncbi:TIR domain-containing protein [bacterium]|nr:TIR domain-containing protein [bacterium]
MSTRFIDAIVEGDIEEVTLILEEGIDVNAPVLNEPPLFHAIRAGKLRIVALLLRHNADPNRRNRWGFLPVTEALVRKDRFVAKLLILHGGRAQLLDFTWRNLTRFFEELGWLGSVLWEKLFHSSYVSENRLNALVEILHKDGSDVFISYRTLDVQYVRLIVEQLLASGIGVWFDEYHLATSEKQAINADPAAFDKLMEEAIKSCGWAICFTNSDYSSSPYCISEAEQILNEIPAERIVNVSCPLDPKIFERLPSLHRVQPLAIDNRFPDSPVDELEALWDQINGALNCPETDLKLDRTEPDPVVMKWVDSVSYSLDFAGWTKDGDREVEGNSAMDVRGGAFVREINGMRVRATVDVGLQSGVYRNWIKDVKDRPRFIIGICEMIDVYAKRGYGMDLKVIGYHFIEVLGCGHPFFTLYDEENGIWWRQYSLVFPNPLAGKLEISNEILNKSLDLGEDIEVCLQFGMPRATFQQVCKVGYMFDRIATSLQFPIDTNDVKN